MTSPGQRAGRGVVIEGRHNVSQWREADTGWVLSFDQADALFGRPGGVDAYNSRYGNQAVAYLLRRAEEYRGVVILSTGARPYLGGRAMSRIDQVVDFPPY